MFLPVFLPKDIEKEAYNILIFTSISAEAPVHQKKRENCCFGHD
jgi:hypothetical protein